MVTSRALRIGSLPGSQLSNADDSYYVWLLVHNRTKLKESCASQISISGPTWWLGDNYSLSSAPTIDPNPHDTLASLQEILPDAYVTTVVSTTEVFIASLEGQLFADLPAQNPIMLFFYPQLVGGTENICGDEVLGIPLAAFRYDAEDGRVAQDYFVQQVGVLQVEVRGTMLATMGSSKQEWSDAVIRCRTWYPSD